MKISERGLKLIKEFEGCLKPIGNGRFTTYYCPANVLTIGWGHTNDGGRPFKKGDVWTQAECDQALKDDMTRYEAAVLRRVKVPLTQNQFDALVSFTYNCGEGNLAKSTLLKKVNARDFEGAYRQFAAWNKGGGQVLKGLVRRRSAEALLFRSPYNLPPMQEQKPLPPRDPMPQQIDPPAQDRPSFVERAWTWLTGGGVAGLAAWATDWRVVGIVVCALLIVGVSGIWFMGPDNVRAWIRRKVNR